jgi:molybdate transport system ATP-binding protein
MPRLNLDVTLERPEFALRAAHDLAVDGIVAVFGRSGAGKTTLLRTIAGLERDARGTIEFDDAVWQDARSRVPAHRRRIGYVFQDGRLFEHLDVERNLEFAARRAPASAGGATQPDVVAALDLSALMRRRPASLSGGERQRVALARALLTRPRLLLMDEPLSALDAQRKREILPHIERLPKVFGVPVLYVTHNIDEVVRLADSVLLMDGGRITAHGGVVEIFDRLDPLAFGGAFDSAAVLRTEVAGYENGVATLCFGSQRLRVPMREAPRGLELAIRIHARDVAVATRKPEHLSIRNVLPARILSIEGAGGAHVDLTLDIEGAHLRSRITRDALEDLRLSPDQSVFALIKSVALESALG